MKKILLLLMFCATLQMVAQEPATSIGQGIFLGKSIPLRDFPLMTNDVEGRTELRLVPNNFPTGGFQLPNALPQGEDPVRQSEINVAQNQLANLGVNFDGANSSESGGATPPDPSGAVGPNHYVQGVNLAIKVYDKTGALLAGPTSLGNFIGDGQNSGDPIIMYDQLADRWFVSQFNTSNNGLAIAISETPDPTGAYFLYEFPLDSFPDYPHYSVWHDAYYMTANKGGQNVFALERDVMIAGGANPQILGFNLPGVVVNNNTVFSPEPAYLTGTDFDPDAPGYITYLQDDGWGAATDHLKVWELDIDFGTPGNSSVSAPIEIPVAPFDSFIAPFGSGELQQPGTSQRIDMITGLISYAAHYRSFEDHNSWLVTFNVDVESNNDVAGVRWIELRNSDTDPWSVYQEGTYAPDDGNSRFMGSGAIDAQGNIGLAFNIGGPDMPVGIAYTGRFENDDLGTMSVAEEMIINGAGVQTNTNRFGDYSQLSMDPDNFTFWHTAEYFTSNNQWSTRIASFTLSGGFANDVGVATIDTPEDGALTVAEVVTVSVRNFGTEVQTNIPIELMVDGVVVANEVVPGPIVSNGIETYTFTQTIDLSTLGQEYVLTATTNLVGDEFETNDTAIKNVTHLFMDDIGAVAILSPMSGFGLTDAEQLIVTIENFGSADQSNFDITFNLDGTEVTESVAGPLMSGATLDYTFTQTLDLSAFQTYTLSVFTSLAGDADTSNDSITTMIQSNICEPNSDCSGFGDGVTEIDLADQNIQTECGPDGYADNSDVIFNFILNENPFEGVLQVGFAQTEFVIFIDFNDNNLFEANEIVANSVVENADTDFDFTVDFNTIPTTTTGMHRMRVIAAAQDGNGNPQDPCGDIQFGRTNDYTANITGALSVEEQAISDGELVVTTLEDNKFNIQLSTTFDGALFLSVYNVLGQQLKHKPIAKTASGFGVVLDMNAMPTGVYLLKLGSGNPATFKTARVIVR